MVPLVEQLATAAQDADSMSTEDTIDMLRPLLSAETLTVLQVLGFNFKQAVGEPLTILLREQILKLVPDREGDAIRQQQTLEALRLAQDPEGIARFQEIGGT